MSPRFHFQSQISPTKNLQPFMDRSRSLKSPTLQVYPMTNNISNKNSSIMDEGALLKQQLPILEGQSIPSIPIMSL